MEEMFSFHSPFLRSFLPFLLPSSLLPFLSPCFFLLFNIHCSLILSRIHTHTYAHTNTHTIYRFFQCFFFSWLLSSLKLLGMDLFYTSCLVCDSLNLTMFVIHSGKFSIISLLIFSTSNTQFFFIWNSCFEYQSFVLAF